MASLFVIAAAEIPDSANTISDFQAGADVIGIGGLTGVTGIVTLASQSGTDTLINALDKDLTSLPGIQAGTSVVKVSSFSRGDIEVFVHSTTVG